MSTPTASFTSTFSSLRTRNFRLFASGQVVSNTGAWVQRIAQDWLVLTLTGSATAVGITTALQFLPTLLFGLYGGLIADRYNKRRVLLLTQIGMASMSAGLAWLTLTDRVLPWHVYRIAFGLGLVTAVDNPTRQSFVNEMVGPEQLRNAISLNASVFQLGALIGPAVSGYLINAVGSGYSFAINTLSFVAPFIALMRIDESQLNRTVTTTRSGASLRDGLRYVLSRPDVLWPTTLVGMFGIFTINLPVTLAAYANTEFHSGASGYGTLSSAVALGSVVGALVSARRTRTRLRGLTMLGAIVCVLTVLTAAVGEQWAYTALLAAVGAATLLFLTSANSTVQLAAEDGIRGRVMGVYLLVFIGSGAIGGPLLGAIDQHFGPRTGMLVSGVVPGIATVVVALRLAHDGHLRLQLRPAGSRAPLLAVVSR
ncbi:MFS transporter [Jatrophihabitans telluris]|uniref:MFS transporter n=1 Tax=Jatrophihabitans telluris TaxID=2038343 RepID=A0ABY4QWW3_9ACTN|nr:MFS transporter [Jatrophihabitans telluris]UQX88025.1 MFS transporter [Jatrophihabitans telluris]